MSWVITTYHIFEKFYKRPGNILTNFLSCQQQNLSIHLGVKKADKYFTTSPLVIDYLLSKKCDSDKMFLTDCAVDIDAIDRANCEMEQYDACFLARLNYSKGVLELPDIWEKVVETLPNAKLAIIGKGKPEFETEIENMISSKKLDRNIDMLGYLSSEKAWSLIKKSKCFLFTSHEEGWGMSVAEALTAGTPVVAYRLPIFEKLFPLGTRYCDFLNIDQMSEEVVNIISDNILAEKLGQEGSEFIRSHYTLDGMAQKELKLILE